MSDEKIGLFNLQDFLDSDPKYSVLGAKIVDVSPAGLPVAKTAKGEEIELNPAEILAAKGRALEEFDFEVNTPDTAIEKSPVGFIDRLKLTTSTPARSLPYLKSKFEDAVIHPDKGVLVKQNGAWAQVDPEYLGTGTPWEKTKELAKDFTVDVADELVSGLFEGTSAAAGAAAGALAGPVGAYAASIPAAAAGNIAFNKLRFRLGRAIGTYSATEEEQLQDEAFEMIAAAAGQAAAPFIGKAVKAATTGLGWMAKGVVNTPKALVQIQAKMLGTEADNLYRVAERPAQVENTIKNAWAIARSKSRTASSGAAQQVAQELQQKEVTDMLIDATDELPRRYVEAVQATANEAEKLGESFSVDVGKLTTQIMDNLADRENPYLMRQLVTSPGRAPQVAYRPLTETEAAKMDGKTFFDQKAFNKFVQRLNGWKNEGQLTGKDAVERLAQVKKSINEVLRYPAEAARNNPAELQKIAEIGALVDKNLDGVFGAPGSNLRTAWEQKGAAYRTFSDAVNWGRQLMNDTTGRGLEAFTKQLASTTPGRGVAAKQMVGAALTDNAGSLVQLLGDRGVERLAKIKDLEAARALIPAAPRIGLVNAIAGPSVLMGLADPVTKVATATGLLAQSTPAVVAKEAAAIGRASAAFKRSAPAQAVGQFTDFIKGVSKKKGPQFVGQILQDKQFQNALIQSITKNWLLSQNTSAMAKQLVDKKLGGGK